MEKHKEALIIGLLLALFVVSAGISILQTRPTATSAVGPYQNGIGLVQIEGPITFSAADMWGTGQGADSIIAQIQELGENNKVKAIVLRINSPGGTVGASQEIFAALKQLKNKRKIPIITSVADVGASGAYWVALASDTIFANPGSMVGSIGVLIQQWDLTQIKDRYGIGMIIHKSGNYKDMLSGWRKSTPEENQMLDATLSDIHSQFLDTVITQRGLSTENATLLAQGQIFSGTQAQHAGLIDQLGGLDAAVAYASRAAKLGENPAIIYPADAGFPRWIQQLRRQFTSLVSVKSLPLPW